MNSYILNDVAKRWRNFFLRENTLGARWSEAWVTSAIMTHVGNHESWHSRKKKYCFLRCFYRLEVRDGGNHESRRQSWLTSTALLYQFLRWNLSCNISWVRRNHLFKLGFLVPLRTDGFSCYNPTQTSRVREITRRRVKQIILSIYRFSFTEWF